MNKLEQLGRLRKAHSFIKQENTGTPSELANKLHISRRQLFNIINELKEMDATILFNRKTNSYFYNNNFELYIDISIRIITDEESRTIYAGQILSKQILFSAMLLHGTNLS